MYSYGDKVVDGGALSLTEGDNTDKCTGEKVCVTLHTSKCLDDIDLHRLSGKMPWQYDGKASCMSKQSVTLLYWFLRPAKTMNALIIRF